MIGAVVGSDAVRWGSVPKRGGNFWPSEFEWSRSTLPNQRTKIGHTKRSREELPLFGLLSFVPAPKYIYSPK